MAKKITAVVKLQLPAGKATPGLFFVFVLNLEFILCMIVLLACISTYLLHAWCPLKSEEGIRSPGTGDTDCDSPNVGTGN